MHIVLTQTNTVTPVRLCFLPVTVTSNVRCIWQDKTILWCGGHGLE